ncbi:hypothetical protein POPTR_004G037750v4 [Populus trichocarpa]|uniref:Uncharacterized protein n=1 Tax=Populus trichocarpa TaxID=3694 RepID=A0ACC0T3C3_POPTR|nr:hypothetical protein POPTR_004G037750v4 [Populus trichocarpa]
MFVCASSHVFACPYMSALLLFTESTRDLISPIGQTFARQGREGKSQVRNDFRKRSTETLESGNSKREAKLLASDW